MKRQPSQSNKCLVCSSPTKPFLIDLFDDRYGAPGRHDIYRCDRCGFGRIWPGLSPSQIGTFYAKYYPLAKMTSQSVKAAVSLQPRWRAWLSGTNNIAHHYIKAGQKVLDIGSASGVSLLEIQSLGGDAYGVEPDPNAARLAKQLRLKVFTGFIIDNPFHGEKFDVISASQVIEHTPDPRAFLAAVARRMKNDGQVILSFPNLDAFYRKIFGRRWLHWHIPYHYNFFTRRSFELLASQSGLAVVKVRTITPNVWTLIQLRSLLTEATEGVMGPVWAAQHGQPGQANPFVFKRLVRYGVAHGGLTVITFLNRVVDAFGLGESFLVWLKKEAQ